MRPLLFLPIVVGVIVVPVAPRDYFLMMRMTVVDDSFLFMPLVVPKGFFLVFLGVPFRLVFVFFSLLRSAFGPRLPFGARMMLGLGFGMHLPRRRIGVGHRVEDRAARRAQTRLVSRHASRHPRDVGNFIGAQTKCVRLAGLARLVAYFEGMRREAWAEAEEGRQHDESRSISNSAAFHNNSP
jgi:hypothetical protein